MPGKIKVKVLAGRNLPVMDRAGETTDAFVEIKFGGVTHKTDVCRKSLNPHWNSTEWYRFEVDESELQDEPLQLRLMDHDTYSANDAIGKVVISLAPLLAREANNAKGTAGPPGGAVMSGWIPVFDTMHGIRGELNVIVKVELFSDFNKYKTSSCGVQFFHCPMIPPGYRATSIHGFVEELVVNDDPEYQWIDKIRTPRASNEARQVAFIKLSNQVQRLVGLKASELGANAVVGYQQDFDLEGEAGVVARAIATDDESITDLNQYYQTHQEELQKMLTILNPNASSLLDEADVVDEDEKSIDMTRQSSLTSYAGTVSLYQDDYASHKSLRHLSEDQIDLNRLLNRTDGYDSDSNSPLQKIKKLKTNFFSKRFQGMRSRKSDKQDDQISLKSNSSDTSRITLDIKNELKKLKRLKKPKLVRKVYVNKEEEGVGMASILARSVIHARTSLACIAETQDSENSPGSTLRHTSESEPTMNKSDDDKPKPTNTEISPDKSEDTKLPEIRFTSLGNIKSDVATETVEVRRKISESCPTTPIVSRSDNLLKLPGEVGYFESVSSALSASGESSEFYSSSDDDDESSDVRTDTERSIETTSSVVQSVLSHEVDPMLISQMEKKLTILIDAPLDVSELKNVDETESEQPKTIIKEPVQEIESNEKIEICAVDNAEPSTSALKETETCVVKPNNHSIKLHNPFAHKKASKSISAPSSPVEKSSFVYRSSKRIKRQLSKLSNSSMIKSLSHYSLLPKKKHEAKTMSRPVSSSDLPSKTPSDTVLGSPFMSYADLLSLDNKGIDVYKSLYKSDDLDRAKVSMYIGSEPVSRASFSGSLFPYNARDEHHFEHKKEKPLLKPTGLVHTAMETMLIDKVQSLLLPTSPDSETAKTKQFFEDVSDKLEKVEEDRNKKGSTGAIYIETSKGRPLVREISPDYSSFIKKQHDDEMKNCKNSDGKRSHHESTGLIHTAVESILIDRVQSLLGPTTPEPITEKQVFHEPHIESHACKAIDHHTDDKESSGLVHTAMPTILMDKVTSLIGRKTPGSDEKRCIDDYSDTKSESCSSVHTVKEKTIIGKLVPFHEKTEDSTGLVHTAMETMLMDKVQSLLGPKSPDSLSEQQFFEEHKQELQSAKDLPKKDNESSGLVHTAMETMLMDKVQSLLGPKSPDSLSEQQLFEEHKQELQSAKDLPKKNNESSGLVHTAMETMLMDKVQSLLGPKSPDSFSEQQFFAEHKQELESAKDLLKKDNESSGLVHTAMETMLMDKVQSLIGPKSTDSLSEQQFFEEHKQELESAKDLPKKDNESFGLVHTAMETMLMDKVQSLLGPKSTDTLSEHQFFEEHKQELESAKDLPKKDNESFGLVHTAMETMLMDKVQSLLGPKSTDTLSEHKFLEEHKPKLECSKERRDNESSSLVHTAMETMLMDKVQSLHGPKSTDTLSEHQLFEEHKPKLESSKERRDKESSSLVHTAMETILIDKMQSLLPKTIDTLRSPQNIENKNEKDIKVNKSIEEKDTTLVHTAMETIHTKPHVVSAIPKKAQDVKKEKNEEPDLLNTAMQTILMDTVQSLLAPAPESDPTKDLKENIKPNDPITDVSIKKDKKLVRQDSIHSVTEKESQMSNEIVPNIVTPCKATKKSPVLQHFHPILSGAPLETIPSLPESSLDHAESLDIEGVEETNTASVCGNSHAACRFDRSERDRDRSEKDKGSPRHARHESYGNREPVVMAHAQNSSLNASSTPMGIHRRSSDSDLSVTPKGGSLNTSAVNVGSGGGAILRPSMNSNNLDMLEYPFLTMTEYPPGFIVHIGGTVCARSVKLVDAGGESALRAAWWAELRTELRAHARALRCNAVIAYVDTAAICEDVCVLSASGTAAVINLECDYNTEVDTASASGSKSSGGGGVASVGGGASVEEGGEVCSVGHVPYSPGAGPYRVELSTCGGCRRARVPAVLLATCTKPNRLTSYAKAVTLTAVAARLRRAPPTGEPAARDISDQLPFLEYELHKLLLAKLRMQGANALFSLQTQIAIGERFVMALASGTAFRLTALPPPTPPRIKASENDRDALEIQKALWDSFTANRAANGYDVGVSDHNTNGILPEVEGEDAPALDLCADKDACVLELDEAEDVETARALATRRGHMRVFTAAVKPARGATPHAFAQVWRGRLTVSGQAAAASPAAERHVSRALDGVAYKLRRLQPCALVAPRFQLELPEDEIQLVVSGAAIPLQDPSKPDVNANGTEAAPGNHGNGTGDTDDDIFTLDEEQLVKSTHSEAEDKNSITGHAPTTVSLTSLAHMCGAVAARRVCALRLLFVRETTAVRELGGLSGFLHTFTCEVLAIVRAYTAALGGNALTSFYITQLMLQDNAHKNQGQCLLSVGGDVVHVTY